MRMELIKYEDKYQEGVIAIYKESLGIDREIAINDIKHHFQSSTSEIFIAVENEKVYGVVTVYWQEWNKIGRIGIIGVSKDAQGKGIGKKLIEKVFDFARDISLRKIYVDTSVNNKAAQIFYIKTGFYPEHIWKDYYQDGEDGINFAQYVK